LSSHRAYDPLLLIVHTQYQHVLFLSLELYVSQILFFYGEIHWK